MNDTILPDFWYGFDPQSSLLEISFHWQGMYSHFSREKREVAKKFNVAATVFRLTTDQNDTARMALCRSNGETARSIRIECVDYSGQIR